MPTPGSPALCQGDSAVHPNTTLFVNHASRRQCGLAGHTDRADKDESRPLQHWLRRSCGFAPKNQPALTRCTDQQRSILTDGGSAESPPCLTLPAQTPWPGGSTLYSHCLPSLKLHRHWQACCFSGSAHQLGPCSHLSPNQLGSAARGLTAWLRWPVTADEELTVALVQSVSPISKHCLPTGEVDPSYFLHTELNEDQKLEGADKGRIQGIPALASYPSGSSALQPCRLGFGEGR